VFADGNIKFVSKEIAENYLQIWRSSSLEKYYCDGSSPRDSTGEEFWLLRIIGLNFFENVQGNSNYLCLFRRGLPFELD